MKRALTALTVTIVTIAAAAMAFAGITAQPSSATPTLCHSTTLSIKCASSVYAGRRLTVSGALAQAPAHPVKVTLQYRRAGTSTWIRGNSAYLSSTGSYTLKWTAPTRKAYYKIRVRMSNAGVTDTSAVRTVRVK